MNPDTRHFERVTEATPTEWPRFKVGEEHAVNGVVMRVRKVTRRDVILRPVAGPSALGVDAQHGHAATERLGDR